MTTSSPLRTTLFSILLLLLVGWGAPHIASADDPPALPPTTQEDPALVQQYQQLIQPDVMASQLYYFASDRFMGRDTGSPHLNMAAEYLASLYQQYGVAPRGTKEVEDPRSLKRYFQPVELFGNQLQQATLRAHVDDENAVEHSYNLNQPDGAFYPVFGNLPASSGGIVFAGYGIDDEDLGYNDFAALEDEEIDITGQWVILLHNEPMDEDGQSLLTDDGDLSGWTEQSNQKLQRIFSAGTPAGILIVGDAGPRAIDIAKRAQMLAELADPGSLSLREEDHSQNIPPVHMISSSFANDLLAPSGQSVEEAREAIHQDLSPVVFEVPDISLDGTLTFEPVKVDTENVLGFVEGSDPDLKDEVIVITSHYDHIGISRTASDENFINNGADDNGSGTIGTVAMARAFQQAAEDGYGPRRSIFFMNVTAEERGLLGSAYYTDVSPVFPLEQTVLNINMDMIGRIDPSSPTLPDSNYVYIIGADLISEDLHETNVHANEATDINLTLDYRYNDPGDPQQLFRRSDQWNFGKHNIPFIFYFTGLHDDYHDVGDEAHKIEYDRMADIVRLAFATVWDVANKDERPEVTGEGFN